MMLFLSLSNLVVDIEFVMIQIPLYGYNPLDIIRRTYAIIDSRKNCVDDTHDYVGGIGIILHHISAIR